MRTRASSNPGGACRIAGRGPTKKFDTAEQPVNFFALLFGVLDGNGVYKPVKLNPYQPPLYRSGEVIE